jgi:hypothetical protein
MMRRVFRMLRLSRMFRKGPSLCSTDALEGILETRLSGAKGICYFSTLHSSAKQAFCTFGTADRTDGASLGPWGPGGSGVDIRTGVGANILSFVGPLRTGHGLVSMPS